MKKKNYAVSTNLVVLDQGYIRKHCLDKEFWKRSWDVFNYKNFKATVRLYSINVKSDTYVLSLQIGSYTMESDFPLNRDDFTDKMFNSKLLSMLSSVVTSISWNELYNSHEYDGYAEIDEQMETQAREMGKTYCDEHNVEEKQIRETIINGFADRTDTSRAYRFIENNKSKIHPDIIAAFAYWLNLREEAKKYDQLIDPKIRKRLRGSYLVALQRFKATEQGEEDAEL